MDVLNMGMGPLSMGFIHVLCMQVNAITGTLFTSEILQTAATKIEEVS